MKKVDLLIVGGLNAAKIAGQLFNRYRGVLSQYFVTQSYLDIAKNSYLQSNIKIQPVIK